VIIGTLGGSLFGVVQQLYLLTHGFSSGDIGSIMMMRAISSTLFTIPMGVLADRYGRKKIFLLGQPIGALSLLLNLTANSPELFHLAFLLMGVSSATGVVWTPLYSSFFSRKDMDRAFSLLSFVNVASRSLGSIMGLIPPMLVNAFGFTFQYSYWLMLLIDVGCYIISTPFLFLAFRGVVEPKQEKKTRFSLRSKGVVMKFSLLRIIMMLGYTVFFSLFPFYVNKKFGIESDGLGTLFFLSNIVSAGVNLIASRISSKIGTLKAIVSSLSCAIPFYLMIAFAPNFYWLSTMYVTRLGIRAIANPLTNSLFMKMLYPEEKATANSIRLMTMSSSEIVASWYGGQLMEHVSLEFPIYLGTGIYVVHAAAFYFLMRNEKEREK
jgi:MFS family permease